MKIFKDILTLRIFLLAMTMNEMRTSNFAKFRLLMWKNWLLQWRHKLSTTVEVLAPVIFSALLVVIRGLVV